MREQFYLLLLIFNFISTSSSQKICDITTYGAVGDGKTLNTASIQKAIDDCSSGGTLLIPSPGVFLTYPIFVNRGSSLKINVASGAVLRAGTMDDWPVDKTYVDFLQIRNCENCALTGNGLIDGQGTPWYILFDEGKLKHRRPYLVVISNATNFILNNLNILNAPMFNIVLEETIGAEISFLNITAQWYNNGTQMPHNTDGIDPGLNSVDIHIHDCYIFNGDDSVAVKPGTIEGGCTRNILVENCYFSHGHGCSIGSIGTGCIQDVVFRNITMVDQLAGVRIKTYSQGSGWVKNITWSDITMEHTDICITVDTNYKNTTAPPGIVISDINISNVVGTHCNIAASFICQSELPCQGISLDNVNTLKRAEDPKMTCAFAHGTAVNVQPTSCLLPNN